MNDLDEKFEIVTLKSGIKSLRSRQNRQIFHPGVGPLQEAKILHVGQHRFSERTQNVSKFILWDVGLGAAANAVSAVEALLNCDTSVEIHSFDRSTAPLEFALDHPELEYLNSHYDLLRQLIAEKQALVRPGFMWHLHLGDFRETMDLKSIPAPHSIFYDPYSPSGNHEMWTLQHFKKLYGRLDPQRPCLLSNYTRSTAARVTLLLAGFQVGVGCLIGEKEETTLASNDLSLLEKPLDSTWLQRVKVSGNAAPLSGSSYQVQPIQPEDFAKLQTHQQF